MTRGDKMDHSTIKSFIDSYYRDKAEINRKFDALNRKVDTIGSRIEGCESHMKVLDKKISGVEEVQKMIFGNLCGPEGRLDNIRIFLSTIETRLNEYKTIQMEGHKIMNGEFYSLRVCLHKVKPMVNWENNKILLDKYKCIEEQLLMMEKYCSND